MRSAGASLPLEARRCRVRLVILRDPIHGLVAFEGVAGRLLGALLDTPEVQRLRRIRQLGLTALVFPGAEHTRFAHAVGAAHVMGRLLGRFASCSPALPPPLRVEEEARAEAMAAALLHDLGHGPFSHTFETLLPGALAHEQWTQRILLDPDTDVHRVLESFATGTAGRVAAMLRGVHRIPFLARAVSGSFDVDRLDYLLRDSQATGVRYGLFDLDWLLRAVTVAELPSGQWVLAVEGRKGLPPFEEFFLGRYFMFQQVYHHKATRAAECLLRAVVGRVVERVRDGRPPPGVPRALERAARGEAIPLGEYLALDDGELLSAIHRWAGVRDDAFLASAAEGLLHRRLPKTVPLPERGPDELWEVACAAVREVVDCSGGRSDLEVWLDVPEVVAYEEPEGDVAEGLWVRIRRRPLQRLGEVSFLLRQLRNARARRPRIVFPHRVRDRAESALEALLGGAAPRPGTSGNSAL